MSDQNITVVVQRTWQVLVLRDADEQYGELIDDAGFETYPEALLYAAQQADEYGIGITYHADSFI